MPQFPRAGARSRALGENVRRLRVRRGMLQRDLADACGKGWSQQIVTKLELGQTGMRVEQLLDLCDALDTTPGVLLRGVREAR